MRYGLHSGIKARTAKMQSWLTIAPRLIVVLLVAALVAACWQATGALWSDESRLDLAARGGNTFIPYTATHAAEHETSGAGTWPDSSKRRLAIFGRLLPGCAATLVVVFAIVILGKAARHAADARLASRIENLVETELRADRYLLDTFGSLIELAGCGFVRPRLDAVLVDRLEIARQAHFENGSLDVHIFAPGDRGLYLSCARVGITRWELSDDGLEVGVSSLRCPP